MAPEIITPGAEGKGKLFFIPPNATMLQAALIYAAFGWPVFPCWPVNKRPSTFNGFKDATTDPERIRRCWQRYPNLMIGVPMGSWSGVFAVDLDRKQGHEDGVASWTKLIAEHGAAPTLSSTTPSTGQHHLYDHVEGVRSFPLDKLAPGVEVKGEGGYVIVPPSFCTDPKFNGGASYTWNEPLLAPAPAPEWLVRELLAMTAAPNFTPPPSDDQIPVAIERIKAALAVIDPDMERKPWIAIGCALYKELGDAGFALWDEWSRRGQKCKPGEMKGQWEGIVKGNGYAYTIGTLFWHANQARPDWDQSHRVQVEEPNWPGTPADGGHHEAAWPEMDEAAFHGFAGDVVRTIAPHSESDPVALLLQLLTCFGNIINRSRYYLVESSRQQANLFIALVGATSKTRKGTSFNRIQTIIDIADHVWTDEHIAGGLSSGEGLIYVVRDPIIKWDKKANEFVEMDPGVDDKRLTIVEPEFAGVLTVMERSGNTISHLLRKAWDGSKLQTMTRKEPLIATGAHISIIGHITQDELRARLTHTEMANGFANRFLFALIKRSKELPFGGTLSDSDIQHLGEEFKRIVDAVKGDPMNGRVPPPHLTMTEAAAAEWARVYSALSAERPGLLGAITARAEAQTIRLALIYALLDRANQIDVGHLRAGLAVWNYCDASAAHIFGATLGDDVADTILRALKNAGREGMSRSMIRDLFGGHHTSERVGAALGLLAEKGCARAEQRATRGRPVEMWFAR
jgi:Bifunctional DNA primase/polymerase, N-terminal/Protein of unknown function (DUF3987)/Primase C terminal 2 (PriCT-2)